MSSRLPTRLTSSLTALAAHAGGVSRNRDGWGIGFYQGRDVALFKEAAAASDSPLVRLLETQGPSTTLIIAHIRHATQGAISLANTAPFARELAGRMRVFAHNGNLHALSQAPAFNSEDFQPVGASDSEQAFCALLARMKVLESRTAGLATLPERLALIGEFAAELRSLGPANFLYGDGDALFAHADRRLNPVSGLVEAPALYRWQCPLPHALVKPELSRRDERSEQRVTFLASVPLTDEGWSPLAEGEIVALRNGEVAATLLL